MDSEEMFARTFERWVQRKLEKQGRKNTYLSGMTGSPLWPTDEEVDHMSSEIEKIVRSHFGG